MLRQGTGWLTLDWKKPADGSAWKLAGMAVDTEITLNNQTRGKEFEYRVIAVNKTGDGGPSSTVTAIL